ncbi:MAG: hypothetical protein E7301_12780 [Butyrivibrio sp.]|nr:hypothetical protein [Butyrivibrio sp.]
MGLEVENEVKAPKAKTKRVKEMLQELETRMEELKAEKAAMQKEIEALETEASALGEKSAVGLVINHEKFGKGTIITQDGKYVEVKFESVVKKFVLPGAIADGYLVITDEELLDYYKKANDIHVRTMKSQLALSSAEFAIERTQDDIDKINSKS